MPGKRRHKGTLVIIGGHEDKTGEMKILKEVVRKLDKGKLCIATIASRVGDQLAHEYEKCFRSLGVKEISHLGMAKRDCIEEAMSALEGVRGVFFTGGDQLRITSDIGGTSIEDRLREIYQSDGLIAGTSAGASIMSDLMLISGPGARSYRIGSGLRMAPGLGLIHEVLIDQHFAERGRIGRLLGGLAHNPKYLGIGLDEDTAIVVEGGRKITAIGDGAVYIVDAHTVTESNISDADDDNSLSLFDVKLHILSEADSFDLRTRRPKLISSAAQNTDRTKPQRIYKKHEGLKKHRGGKKKSARAQHAPKH